MSDQRYERGSRANSLGDHLGAAARLIWSRTPLRPPKSVLFDIEDDAFEGPVQGSSDRYVVGAPVVAPNRPSIPQEAYEVWWERQPEPILRGVKVASRVPGCPDTFGLTFGPAHPLTLSRPHVCSPPKAEGRSVWSTACRSRSSVAPSRTPMRSMSATSRVAILAGRITQGRGRPTRAWVSASEMSPGRAGWPRW